MEILVNDTKLWYEKVGQGPPIILLHGNGESHEIFHILMEQLAATYTVYAIDSRGHGKSEPVDHISYELMAEDVVAFVKTLALERPMLYGFSDGGIIGLLVAIRQPDVLSRLAISGANTKPEGLKSRWRWLIKVMYRFNKDDKFRMMLEEPDIKTSELEHIQIPVLVLAGKRDMVLEANTRLIANHIPDSELQILSGETHRSYVVNSPKLYPILQSFFKIEMEEDQAVES